LPELFDVAGSSRGKIIDANNCSSTIQQRFAQMGP